MGEHRCVQAQSIEHLAHISPAVVCVVNVGQDLPLRKMAFIGCAHDRLTKWRETGFDLTQTASGPLNEPRELRLQPSAR
jgi:hypothetical protein